VPLIRPLLEDTAPVVRAMAIWSLSRLMRDDAFACIKNANEEKEMDANVRQEW
jgi:epoxyqueuosine reductase